MFSSYGAIMKPSADEKVGWYLLKADDSIGAYYKWFYSKAFRSWQSCMNGCHVTFIAGEKDDRIVLSSEMDKYIGKEIVFYYTNKVWTNGQAFWIPALSPELDDIRIELGLKPRFLYHITLGNCKNKKG